MKLSEWIQQWCVAQRVQGPVNMTQAIIAFLDVLDRYGQDWPSTLLRESQDTTEVLRDKSAMLLGYVRDTAPCPVCRAEMSVYRAVHYVPLTLGGKRLWRVECTQCPYVGKKDVTERAAWRRWCEASRGQTCQSIPASLSAVMEVRKQWQERMLDGPDRMYLARETLKHLFPPEMSMATGPSMTASGARVYGIPTFIDESVPLGEIHVYPSLMG